MDHLHHRTSNNKNTGEIIQTFIIQAASYYVVIEQLNFYVIVLFYINTQILKGYRSLFPKLKLNRIKWLRMFIFGGNLVRLVFSILPDLINHFVFNLDYRILSILYSCALVFSYSWLFVCVMYDNIQCAYLTYKVYNFKKNQEF
jgi:hypothetical protein